MKSTLTILAVGCMGVALAGCAKDSANKHFPQGKNPQEEKQIAPSWKIQLESPEFSQGFTINADGTFKVGGGELKGKITPVEIKELEAAVSTILSSDDLTALPAPTCTAREEAGDTASLILHRYEVKAEVITQSETEVCVSLSNAENAHALYQVALRLAQGFYRDPAGACGQALIEYNRFLDTARSCESNAECAYVDHNFAIAEPNGLVHAIPVDSCQAYGPIGAANKGTFDTLAASDAFQKVQNACGEAYRPGCTSYPIYDQLENWAAPKCVQKKCQVDPAVWEQ